MTIGGFGGMNTWVGGVDVEVWKKATKDSWGEEKPEVLQLTLESVGCAPRTTTLSTNDSFRERIESGYTLYLDSQQISQLTEEVEFRLTFPTGQRAAFALDGSLEGLLWDMNPLSTFNLGNEVNLKFLRRIGARSAQS